MLKKLSRDSALSSGVASIFYRPIFSIFMLVALYGCSGIVETSLPFELSAIEKSDRIERPYTPRITQFTDKRHNLEIGNFTGYKFIPDQDPAKWVKESLQNRGYIFSQDIVNGSHNFCNIALDVNIIDLQTINGTKSANVVFTLYQDKLPKPHTIRGRSSGVLWTASKNEIARAMNNALETATNNLDDTLKHKCE